MASKSQRAVKPDRKHTAWKQKNPIPFPRKRDPQLNFPPVTKIRIARSRHLRDLLHRLIDELHGEIQALSKEIKRVRKSL